MKRWLVLFCAVTIVFLFWQAACVHAQSNDGLTIINNALWDDSGGGNGVLNVGWVWLNVGLVAFYTLYTLYLGVGIGFGQGDSSNVISVIIGACVSFGASLIGGLFFKILF